MGAVVVVGAQWGDEGKGKVVDFLAADFDFVVRFHGGSNAGHTVRAGGRTFKFSHIPSGVLRENCRLVIANGVVVEPVRLLEEIDNLKAGGIDLTGRLVISRDCHVTFPYHITLEAINAAAKKGKWDPYSIRRGNGPTHADKFAYLGIKVADLFHPKTLSGKLTINAILKRDLFRAFGHEEPSVDQLMERYQFFAERLEPYVGETVALLHHALDKGARLLMEGAQGTFLDVDHGVYPFVSASNAVAGAVNAGAGIPPRAIDRVIGVAKAYLTRFGGGPFPTEMDPERAEAVRQKGGEIGVNLPEPRRVGWLDIEMLRTAAKLSGIDELVLTKIDVLSESPKLLMGVGVKIGKSEISYLAERDPEVIAAAEPQYVSFEPWSEDLTQIRRFAQLPWRAKDYIEAIEGLVDVPISIVSVGPDRDQTIFR